MNWIADYAHLDIDEVKERERIRKMVEAQQAQLDARAAAQQPNPAPVGKAPRIVPVEHGAPTAPAVTRVANPHLDTATALSNALKAAGSDAERAALLSAAPQQVRSQLNALLTYRKFIEAPDPETEFAALTHLLDTSADDPARVAIIEAVRRDPKRGAKFLSEWHWRRTATADDWRKRYLALVEPESV